MLQGLFESLKLSIFLEIPLRGKDARLRGGNYTLCRLLVGSRDRSGNVLPIIMKFVKYFMPSSTYLFVRSINEFAPITVLSDLQNRGITLLPQFNAVSTMNIDMLADILSLWKAEQQVIFLGSEDTIETVASSLIRLEPKWWQFRRSYEEPYLQILSIVNPILFFSESHMSFDIIGTEEKIMSCFESLKRVSESSDTKSIGDIL